MCKIALSIYIRAYTCNSIHVCTFVGIYNCLLSQCTLTLILLTWTIWRAPTNASKWRMGFNSAFKGLRIILNLFLNYL